MKTASSEGQHEGLIKLDVLSDTNHENARSTLSQEMARIDFNGAKTVAVNIEATSNLFEILAIVAVDQASDVFESKDTRCEAALNGLRHQIHPIKENTRPLSGKPSSCSRKTKILAWAAGPIQVNRLTKEP